MNKIILVAYVNVSQMDDGTIFDELVHVSQALNGLDENVKSIVIPVREGETRVECINPQLVSEEKYKEAEAVVDRATEAINNFINQTKDEAND